MSTSKITINLEHRSKEKSRLKVNKILSITVERKKQKQEVQPPNTLLTVERKQQRQEPKQGNEDESPPYTDAEPSYNYRQCY